MPLFLKQESMGAEVRQKGFHVHDLSESSESQNVTDLGMQET